MFSESVLKSLMNCKFSRIFFYRLYFCFQNTAGKFARNGTVWPRCWWFDFGHRNWLDKISLPFGLVRRMPFNSAVVCLSLTFGGAEWLTRAGRFPFSAFDLVNNFPELCSIFVMCFTAFLSVERISYSLLN